MSSATTTSLPLLDLSRLDQGSEKKNAFLADLRHAARDIGFFYLTGHGVDAALLAQVQREARAFFALPEAQKQAVAMIHSPYFRGYNRAASELTRGQPDWREQFDLGAERAPVPQTEHVPGWTRLQGPNQWPAQLPSLKPVLLRWQAEMTTMSLRLLRAFAQALALPVDSFDTLYGDQPNEHIKLIRYPGRSQTGSAQGVGAHKDSGFLSFLLQDRQKGLQVEIEPDRWVDAAPVDGTLVVNIGELLELATNGYLRATVHRVVSPPAGQDRLSIAFFLGARLDAVVPLYQLPAELAAQAADALRVAADPVPHSEILNFVKTLDPGLKLEIIELTSGVNANELLAHGDVDANYFQHVPYLRDQEQALGQKFTVAATVHIEPLGIYSSRHKTLTQVPNQGTVAVPNNVTNLSRALYLLQSKGLITLKAGFTDPSLHQATPQDIADNPKQLKILEIESPQIPRSLADVDLAVINGNYALEAGLNPARDALGLESAEHNPYANILVTTPKLATMFP